MYKIKTTTKFEKDLKLLKEVIEILSKGDQLWKVKNFLKKNLNKNFWHNKTRVSKLLIF